MIPRNEALEYTPNNRNVTVVLGNLEELLGIPPAKFTGPHSSHLRLMHSDKNIEAIRQNNFCESHFRIWVSFDGHSEANQPPKSYEKR